MGETAALDRPADAESAARCVFLQRIGDNCLILGHRAAEWCGHAPALEEDIALANTALDLIGQTRLWLDLAGEIEGLGRDADDLAYRRDVRAFRNVLLVELPNRDFGHTLMRHYLFDAWHWPLLKELTESDDPQIAEIAGKAAKEAAYHLERSRDLVIRLGDGSDESHQRMQDALDRLWAYTGELTARDGIDDALVAGGIIPAPEAIRAAWASEVGATLALATLEAPSSGYMQSGGRDGLHSEHLGYILAEMQFLQRAYPGARW